MPLVWPTLPAFAGLPALPAMPAMPLSIGAVCSFVVSVKCALLEVAGVVVVVKDTVLAVKELVTMTKELVVAFKDLIIAIKELVRVLWAQEQQQSWGLLSQECMLSPINWAQLIDLTPFDAIILSYALYEITINRICIISLNQVARTSLYEHAIKV